MYTLSLLTGNEYYNGILIPQDDTKFGKIICKILDTIDKNHCEKSIVW